MEHSRMRKNDGIAGVLAWKSPKFRRVDYWEEGRRGGRFGWFVGGLLVEVGVLEDKLWILDSRIKCGVYCILFLPWVMYGL
jgi:hypothetical protein